ncbi:MAG: class A beta-lactamase-related serine hydrolase [Rhodospirillaceae bacterium]|nr:class A beta-lactamase-related serine hydrolase [Rhodospirillaceae bacterium]
MKSVFRALAATAALGAVLGMAAPSSAQAPDMRPDLRKDLRAKFEASLKKFNDDFEGAFAAAFIDLTDGQRVMINPDVVMATASTIKVSILVELFRQAEQKPGLLRQQRPFKSNDATSRSGMGRLLSADSAVSVEDIAKMMINLSENTATNLLIDEVGMENVNKNNAAMGLKTMKLRRKMLDSDSQARGDENVSSAADGAALMYKIATCDLPVSRDSCARIRQIMEIPQPDHPAKDPIPANVPVAFKWGGLEGVSNGWGIVNLPDRPYIFIIMTSYGPRDPSATVRGASQLAFDYYGRLARSNDYGSRVAAPVMAKFRAAAKAK